MLVKDIAKMIIKSINPGKADISGIGDGTIKGGMVFLKNLIDKKFEKNNVIDPMLATEVGFAADALKTKEQVDELNKKLFGAITQGSASWMNAEKCLYWMNSYSLQLSGWIIAQVESNTIRLSGLPDLSKYKIDTRLCTLYSVVSRKGNQYYIGTISKYDNNTVEILLNENLPASTGLFFDVDLKLRPV